MTITSYLFWLLFLPTALLLYWGIFRGSRPKLWFLCAASYGFYALADIRYLPLLAALSLLTFWVAHWQRRRWVGILLNLGALVIFKYTDFGISNVHAVASTLGIPVSIQLLRLALPLGISFYVFKHIGYLVDVSQQRYPPTRDFLRFITFSAFFPQVSAGPISSFEDTGAQLAHLPRRLSGDHLYQGLLHIGMGMAKKLLVADVLSAALQTQLFEATANSGMVWAWASVIIFAFQLYFDFSGYTDIVLGIGYLFGIALPANFNNPYLARNPRDFWQRWHISLSTWFRLYLFTPLSRSLLRRWGTSRSSRAQYTANLVTMTLVGFWHGAGWGYLLWGFYHGVLLNVTAAGQRARLSFPALLARPLFLLSILIGWALFLSPDIAFAQNLLGHMAGLHGVGSLPDLLQIYSPFTLLIALLALLLTLSGMTEAANLPIIRNRLHLFGFGVLFVLCLLRIDVVREFIYVQF